MDFIFFHQPEEENGYLSNWYECSVASFSSSEHYMMWKKAMLFKDTETADKIKAAKTPAEAKKLGREVKNFSEKIWIAQREAIMYEVNLVKFSENEELREKLLSTGQATLAECAAHDRIWGIGLAMDDTARFDVKSWHGQNLLGKSLMSVRAALQGGLDK